MSYLQRQAPTAANSYALRYTQNISLERRPQLQLNNTIPAAVVGATIPIVFCRRVSSVGGTWVVPPLVRTGLQNGGGANVTFNHALLLSQGEITTPVANSATEVYIGTYRFDSFTSRTFTTSFGSLPTAGFTYSITLTQGYDLRTNVYDTATLAVGGQMYYHNTTPPAGDQAGAGSITITSSSPYCTILSVLYQQQSYSVLYLRKTISTSAYLAVSTSGDPFVNWAYAFTDGGGALPGGSGNTTGTATYSRIASTTLTTISVVLDNPRFAPVTITDNATYLYSSFNVVDQHNFRVTETIREPFKQPALLDQTYRQATTGDFAGLTIIGVKGTRTLIQDSDINPSQNSDDVSDYNSAHNKQVTIFCSNGINVYRFLTADTGPSNNIADLINYLALLRADSVSVDTTLLTLTANFVNTNSLFFNGVLADSVNFKDWLETIAPFFLLTPVNAGSQIATRPGLPVTAGFAIDTGVLTPAVTFTENTIEQDSYTIEYISISERKPFEAVMLWRDQAADPSGNTFPYITTTKVRFSSDTGVLPQEQYDMSDFCVTLAHARTVARYFLSRRKRITHTISFVSDLYTTQGLTPGSLIALDLDRVTSSGDNRSETEHYLVDSIIRRQDGTVSIVAEHFPLSAGASVIAADVVSGSFTVS